MSGGQTFDGNLNSIFLKSETHLSIKIQLLHVLVGVSDSDECAKLRSGLGFSGTLHLLLLPSPSVAVEIDAWGWAEEAFLVAVRLLSNFGVKHDDDLK